ncbi:MAG: hypothetical protein EA000_15930 [Oscillatoriales cyanobacterium]|nr:MAG: hypothetical protein EA000_15930 [Oscillatoriales cyanobacterium]
MGHLGSSVVEVWGMGHGEPPPAHWCQLKAEILDKCRFHPSLDPPRIPLKKGDFEKIPVPPLGRGARGDLALIVKQQSLTEFELKLTPMPPAPPLGGMGIGHYQLPITNYLIFLRKAI